ncbi:hypothetical protein OGR47_02690 [Methylocystis sp. MJC1]|uniref:hypothetical protein n=1 Tax=Methylocystis sp. MJC1 TaxID=2654282 RepID=UPI0013EA908A|nr:hypothetical protein [Methylocystis sp. MJC1]KAF2991156.1 hypothetical protein MJC1_01889 [Methylocystis sp. MJC1]MBU6525921.1 hypothetical protein [Methylocystis sp. MJC1]UZX12387.1 hypothetical protein OGR47_02690 [Methylocystis sp. MJC1]
MPNATDLPLVPNLGAAIPPSLIPPSPVAEAPAPTPSPSPVSAIVDAWFNATFPGTAIGGVTENWNFLHAAKEDLKRRLAAKE